MEISIGDFIEHTLYNKDLCVEDRWGIVSEVRENMVYAHWGRSFADCCLNEEMALSIEVSSVKKNYDNLKNLMRILECLNMDK